MYIVASKFGGGVQECRDLTEVLTYLVVQGVMSEDATDEENADAARGRFRFFKVSEEIAPREINADGSSGFRPVEEFGVE